MTDLAPAFAHASSRRWSAALIAAIFGVGAVGIALAVIPSGLFDLDRFGVPKELILVAAATLVALIIAIRAERIELGVAEIALLAFIGWSLLATLFAANHWLALRAFGLTVAGMIWYFGARFAGINGARAAVVTGLLLAVLAATGTGLLQAYGWTSELLADTRAPGGTLGNRNFMAHLAVLGLPLAWWLSTRARGAGTFFLAAIALSMLAGAIVLSRSRAAWVGAAAAILSMAIITMTANPLVRPPRRRSVALLGALALGAAAALVIPNRLDWRSRSPYRDSLRDVLNYREGSGRGRLIQYRNTMAMTLADPLFGAGPGNWMIKYPLVTTPNDPSFDGNDPIPTNPWPSSDWVAMIAERGVLATTAWLGFLASLAVVAFRRRSDPEHGTAAVAAVGMMAAAGAQGVFDAVLLLAPPTAILMGSLGALLPPTRPVRTVTLEGRRFAFGLAAVAIGGLLLIRGAGHVEAILVADRGWSIPRLVEAVRYDPGNHRLRLLLAQRAPCPDARPHAEWAARLMPYHAYPKRLVGRCR